MAAKITRHTSPKGEFKFPYLNKPDVAEFNGRPTKPAFKVNLALGPAEAEQLRKVIDAAVEASYRQAVDEAKPQNKKRIERAYPYHDELDANGNETGRIVFKFKQNAFVPSRNGGEVAVEIPVFDAKGNKVSKSVSIYGGTIGKVSFSMRPYLMASTNKAGVTLDLCAAQVIELVSGSGGASASSFGFGQEEGFDAAESGDAFGGESIDDAGETGASTEDDDEIPDADF